MKAKTTKSKAPAKAAKPVAEKKKKATTKLPAKIAKTAKPSAKTPAPKASKPPKTAKAAPSTKAASATKNAPARATKAPAAPKGAAVGETAKAAARAPKAKARPELPRHQLIALRRKEFGAFRDLLLSRQREQTQAYAASKQDSESHLDNGTEDYIDYAVNSYAREFLLSLTEMDRKQLLQIEEALRRIDRGEYGRCQQCGQEIPRKRLEIQPWARHCVSCQDLEEKGLLPPGTFHVSGEDYDADDEPAAAVDDDLEVEPDVEEPDDEDPVLDDEPLVVDAEGAEE